MKQIHQIDAERAGDLFGASVSLSADGNRLAASAREHDAPFIGRSGRVDIFDLNVTSNTWERVGSPIYGVAFDDRLGSVALSGNAQILAVSTGLNDADGKVHSGHMRAFSLNGTDWEAYGQEVSQNNVVVA